MEAGTGHCAGWRLVVRRPGITRGYRAAATACAAACARLRGLGAGLASRDDLLMCAGETREAAFWESLHATTTHGTGPTFTMPTDPAKAALHHSGDRTATTPDDGIQPHRGAALADTKLLSSRMVDTYDFLADVDTSSNQMLPFLDDVDPSVSIHGPTPCACSSIRASFAATLEWCDAVNGFVCL